MVEKHWSNLCKLRILFLRLPSFLFIFLRMLNVCLTTANISNHSHLKWLYSNKNFVELQIVKLLQMMTPTNDYEERVSGKFIKNVQTKLRSLRPGGSGQDTLLMDTSFLFGVTFTFSPSSLTLDQIDVPESLRCASLVKPVWSGFNFPALPGRDLCRPCLLSSTCSVSLTIISSYLVSLMLTHPC